MKNYLHFNSIANYSLILIFVIFIPFQEWPDANAHWERDGYSNIISNLSSYLGFSQITFEVNNNFNFFSDEYIFESNVSSRYINLIKLLFIIPLFYLLNKISLRCTYKVIPFAPPVIFSILSSSIESFAILSIILSYILILSNRAFLSILVAFLASFIDRSIVPSMIGIIIFAIYLRSDKYFKTNIILLFSVLIIITLVIINIFIPIDIITIKVFEFYEISNNDLLYNQRFGDKNYFAVISSLSGLYGWMSLRPFPWFFYYSLIILFFFIGFFVSDNRKRMYFLCFLIPVLIMLNFLPPMSQARYFPLLTILYWEIVLTGVKYFFNRTDIFIFLVIVMTSVGLLINS